MSLLTIVGHDTVVGQGVDGRAVTARCVDQGALLSIVVTMAKRSILLLPEGENRSTTAC